MSEEKSGESALDKQKRAALGKRIDYLQSHWPEEQEPGVSHRVYIENEIQDAVATDALEQLMDTEEPVTGVDVLYFYIPDGRAVLMSDGGVLRKVDFDGYAFAEPGSVSVSPWEQADASLEEIEGVLRGMARIFEKEIAELEVEAQGLAVSIKKETDPEAKKNLKKELKVVEGYLEEGRAIKAEDRRNDLAFRKVGRPAKPAKVATQAKNSKSATPAKSKGQTKGRAR